MTKRGSISMTRALGRLWRPSRGFLLWWASLFLLVGSTSTCPCCVQQGCPGGWASAGLLGGLVAAMISLAGRVRNIFRRSKTRASPCHECGGPSAISREQLLQ